MTALGDFSSGDVLTAADLNAIGVWTQYTAVVDQGGTVSLSTNNAHYVRMNELVLVRFYLVANATGSANDVTVSLPVATSSGFSVMMGPGSVFDTSTGQQKMGNWFRESSTTVDLSVEPSGRYDTALGNGDIIRGVLVYEA